MSTTSSRFSVENFDPAPDEELICSICRCVFDDPVECPCRHIFCRGCITNWLELKSSCPICRKRVYVMDIQQVVPLIKNMIAKLMLVCPNRENGCKLKTNLESYNQHVSRCLHELISCKNKNCPIELLRKDAQKHEDVDCEFRLILCEKECNLMLPSSNIKHHNCIKELKKQLDESAKREESLNKHIEELTNELNTMKKQDSEFSFNPFTGPPTENSSSSFMDSFSSIFSSDSDDYVTDSPPVLLRNLRSRLSYLDSLMSSIATTSESLGRGNDRLENNVSNISISDAIMSDMGNNNISNGPGNNLNSLGRRIRPFDFEFTNSESNGDSSNSSNHSSAEDSAEVDDEFPTVAQCRILKRKRSASALTVPSDSDFSESENRARRSRTSPQPSVSPTESTSILGNGAAATPSIRLRRLVSRRHRRNFPPVSLVPIAVSSDSSTSSSFAYSPSEPSSSSSASSQGKSRKKGLERTRNLLELFTVDSDPDWNPSSEEGNSEVVSQDSSTSSSSEDEPTGRSSGLERTRELLELFTVETDPDWEPSTEEVASGDENLPKIHPVPAAELLDRMLSDEESDQMSDSDCDVDSNYEVLVPERTYDLLYRYTQEGSDDDEEWTPSRNQY